MADEETILIAVGVQTMLAVLGLVGACAARYKKVPPDAAMIVYGRRFQGGDGFKVYTSGGKFIMPIIEGFRWLPLTRRTLDLTVKDVVTDATGGRARLDIDAVALVRVSSDPDILQRTAGGLLRMTDRDIDELATKDLDGHVRATSAGLTIAQISGDRDAFASRVKALAGEDLRSTGLDVTAFVVKDVEEHLEELIGSPGEVDTPLGPGSRGTIVVPSRGGMRYPAVSEEAIGVGERVLVTAVREREVVVRRASA